MNNGATVNETIEYLLAQVRNEPKIASVETRSTQLSRAEAFRKVASVIRSYTPPTLTFETIYKVKQALYGS
jgi:hypothetical protein